MNEVLTSYKNEDISIIDLAKILYGSKWIIAFVVFISISVAVVFAITRANIYRSEATLVAEVSVSAGQLGGVAAIAGISLGGDASTDKSKLALQIMTSRDFIMTFIKKHDLLVPLIASYGWDADTNTLNIDSDIYDEESQRWVREYSHPQRQIPSLLEAYDVFSTIFKVSEDDKKGIIIVSIEHYSPIVAKEWLDLLIKDINTHMKQRDIVDAEKSLNYLSEQLNKNIPQELKLTLYNLIEEKQKTLMLANVKEHYAFQVIDPSIVPEYRFKPNRMFIVILSALLSFIMMCLFVITRNINKRA